ncbi:aspartate aminotransferase [Lactiplantibacillus paraplantarum]|uniref:Aminotransferase n=2 Tax=Lactiplantibacillus paraplantarum TaxID=60520 RepID=A0AAD0TP87_9LACO|nr:pyridoxal phosphate-dependent aminotransferase [Lactiplantibacillus paraplantarum]AYJ38613.1 pyridoxal phosphate-dependent aminotransferase [Lactiplantibacillus paraplantarum]ERL44105.1 aspartate aminotransferase [Lactiplantibacillus paraplantarum]QJU49489.1 aspartate transaminase [Lactiplantibacillus paraplantarum]GBF00764.1 aspartate aminotransferase [Lactiplantibacillus paraplantarum]
MYMELSRKVMQIQPSATLKISATAKQMMADGIDVINLGIGEPDYQTPDNIKQAAIESIQNGQASFYTPATGLPALKQAISQRIEADHHYHFDPNQIVVTDGAKMALFTLFQVVLNPEDEVLLPVPYWVSYSEQVKLAGGTPVEVGTDEQLRFTTADLEASRTPKTKALVLNSPQNPSGLVFSRAELTAIVNWAVEHDILVVADEIYEKLLYNGNQFTSVLELDDANMDHVVLINGVSKAYSMTGWRIGYAAGPQAIMAKMGVVLGHAASNPAAVSQYAAIEAFSGDQSSVEKMRQGFEARLNELYPLIERLPGFKMPAGKPAGAFYLFPDITEALRLTGYADAPAFVTAVLLEAHVGLVPGEAFGLPGCVRLSYATDIDSLREAHRRLQKFMTEKIAEQAK